MNKVHLRILVIFMLFMTLMSVANSANDTNSTLNITDINSSINITLDTNITDNTSQEIINATTTSLVDESIQKEKDSIRLIKVAETTELVTISYVGVEVDLPVYKITTSSTIRYGVGENITFDTNYVDENSSIELYDATTFIVSSIYKEIDLEEKPTIIVVEDIIEPLEENITETNTTINIITNVTEENNTETVVKPTTLKPIKVTKASQQYKVHKETSFELDLNSLTSEISETTPERIVHVGTLIKDSQGKNIPASYRRIDDTIIVDLDTELEPESYTIITSLFYNNKSYVHNIPVLVNAIKLGGVGVRIFNTTYDESISTILDSKGEAVALRETVLDERRSKVIPETGLIKELVINTRNISELDLDYIGLDTNITNLTGPQNKVFKQAYAIDPEQADIETINLTIEASANTLYKCVDWNFTAQSCYGEWTFLRYITPGEEYTITVDATDPGFGEGDSESLSDSCTFSDQSGQGDGDSAANCQAEINSNNNGFTADLDDLETTGTTAQLDATYTNSYLVDSIAGVNFTVKYQRQTNNQVGTTTANIQVFDSGAYVTACTDTITIGAWETYTCDLSAYITTEAELNNILIRVITDTASTGQPKQVGKTFIDYMYITANFVETDTQAPTYSNIETNIASPTTYSPSATYNFNTTWTDNIGISTVDIEHNFTGIFINSTPTPSGSIYSYSTSLPAGTYSWRYIAQDAATNSNSTPSQTFTVNKADPSITLAFNGTSNNYLVNNTELVNITTTSNGEGTHEILRDGSIIASSASPLTQLELFNTIGTYNITARYNATQNYTSDSVTYFVTVVDTIPPGPVTALANQSNGVDWIYWTWTNPVDSDFDHIEIWLNGTFVENSTGTSINMTGLNADTEYEIQIRTVDIYENIGTTTTDLARTSISLDITPPIISNIINYSITEQSVIVNWTTDEVANSRVKYGTTPGTYTLEETEIFNVLEHSISLTGLQPSTTYYYVVNSSDVASNSVESIEYSFTTLADTTAPTYSGISATPSSPQTYSPITTVFNTTWIDNIGVESVVIEHNFTGSLDMYSITNISDEYSYSYDLSAGTYTWRFLANDSAGNSNSTPSQIYTVNKATPVLSLELNELDANITVDEDTAVNVTGILTTPNYGTIELRRNGTLIDQNNAVVSDNSNYQPGTYEFRVDYFGSDNYTTRTVYKTLTVSDTTAPNVTLTAPADLSEDKDSTVVFMYTSEDNVGVTSCNLYINGTLNETDSSITPTDSFTITTFTNGQYIWFVECYDEAGNSKNSTTRQVNISIDPPTLLGISPASISSWDDADPIVLSDINATDANNEARSVTKGTTRTISYVNFTENIPSGSTIISASFSVRHQGNTRTTFQGINWYDGSQYIGTGCVPVLQTGAFRTDTCDLSSRITTVDQANDVSIQYIVSAANTGSGGSITIDHLYLNISYQPELTPPTLTITNVTLDLDETLGLQVVATDANGIASYTVNDTGRFNINSSGYITNITTLGEGVHTILVTVSDPSGNNASKVMSITVQDLADIEIISTDGIVLYNSTGGIILSGTGTLSDRILSGQIVDIEYESTGFYGLQRTRLYNVNLTKDLNITTQYNDSYTGTLPANIPELSTIFALLEPDLNYSYAQVLLPKKGVDIEYITHCTEWNFTTQDCGAWEVNETADYEFSENSTHFTINVTGFDAFGGGPGDTLPNVTVIDIYDVTGQADGTTGGTLIASGVDTEFTLESNKAYRVAINITNEAKKWILAGSDVARHAGLNNTWNVSNITYTIAGTDYSGGTWSGGIVTWDLSLGGQLDQTESGIWYYVVNITTSNTEIYPVDFLVNDTSKSSGSVDESNFSISAGGPSWHTFYGTLDLNITLGDVNDFSAFTWFDAGATGVLYAIDSDASINFANIYALGRNTSNQTSTDDFTEIDDALNMTGRSDSVTNYFAQDSSTPKTTRSFNINGRTIENVPVVNSTNSSTFQTGIMWDATSDTTGEYDENETLIFIANVENKLTGFYGIYDYEFIIPASLAETEGVTNSVDIYIELE